MKRAVDLGIALALLPAAIPILLIGAILVRISSPGPVLFRQARVGRHEETFICYKLRTMYVGTGDVPSHEAATACVTPVGATLRRLKLDELPQLWNILRGNMSFVGPRPCLPTQSELIEARRRRGLYGILPGITGVAQVAGVDMSDPEKLAELDAAYLPAMSIVGDLRLILRTGFGAGRGDRVRK